MRTGATQASSNEFEIRIEGVGAHAAIPHDGVDPVFTALQIGTGLQSIVTRNKRPIDAAVLSTFVDGTILVVRTASTAREAVRRAVGQLRAVHGRLLGAVLNDVNVRGGTYYGGYGYYYYAYYGAESNGDNGKSRSGLVNRVRRLAGR